MWKSIFLRRDLNAKNHEYQKLIFFCDKLFEYFPEKIFF